MVTSVPMQPMRAANSQTYQLALPALAQIARSYMQLQKRGQSASGLLCMYVSGVALCILESMQEKA